MPDGEYVWEKLFSEGLYLSYYRNYGTEEMISIENLVKMIINISGKQISINPIPGPTGVRGRNYNNKLILEKLKWQPSMKLEDGIKKLYNWIKVQVKVSKE